MNLLLSIVNVIIIRVNVVVVGLYSPEKAE